jgi:threonine/homoserine/homoserine lactone efflux protein
MINDAMAAPALFAVVATISPGGATTLAAASGAQFGFRRSIPFIAGLALGLAMLAVVAAAGLGGLLTAAPSLQVTLKVAGTVYLLYLAWNLARGGPSSEATRAAVPTTLIGGLALLLLNPKGWAMTLGAAASFGAVADGPTQLAALLATVFGLAAIGSLTLWCGAGVLLADTLRTDRQRRITHFVLALLLIASIVPMWRE